MNAIQLDVANRMLKYFASVGGRTNTDDWDNCKELADVEYLLRGEVRSILEQRGYLEPLDERRYTDRLTKKGWDTSKIGIEEYERQEEERERNKYRNISDSVIFTGINTGQISNQSSSPSFNSEYNRNKDDNTINASRHRATIIWTVIGILIAIVIAVFEYNK